MCTIHDFTMHIKLLWWWTNTTVLLKKSGKGPIACGPWCWHHRQMGPFPDFLYNIQLYGRSENRSKGQAWVTWHLKGSKSAGVGHFQNVLEHSCFILSWTPMTEYFLKTSRPGGKWLREVSLAFNDGLIWYDNFAKMSYINRTSVHHSQHQRLTFLIWLFIKGKKMTLMLPFFFIYE